MVKFCKKCGNLYHHAIDKDGSFKYQCRVCQDTDRAIEHCIVINDLNRDAHDYGINPNMIYDYTLPRSRSHKCQNEQCPSNQREPYVNPEIIIFQYNPDILNIGYMCSECRSHWKA